MLKTVLFDLDGTLLPMDNDEFTRGYFKLLAAKLAPHGYEPRELVDGIWAGTAAMVKNDGSRPNEEAFWEEFGRRFGEHHLADKPVFLDFYATDFQKARNFCGCNPEAKRVIVSAKAKGLRTVLATNPIFPAIATESRIRWAGLKPEDFEYRTTYENIGWCKPSVEYYAELLRILGCRPEECLMVGNDVGEDMVAEKLGMQVFLLTDCLINRAGADLAPYRRGGFPELEQLLCELCAEEA